MGLFFSSCGIPSLFDMFWGAGGGERVQEFVGAVALSGSFRRRRQPQGANSSDQRDFLFRGRGHVEGLRERCGPPEMIPLQLVAASQLQHLRKPFVPDTFGHDAQVKALCQIDEAADQVIGLLFGLEAFRQ